MCLFFFINVLQLANNEEQFNYSSIIQKQLTQPIKKCNARFLFNYLLYLKASLYILVCWKICNHPKKLRLVKQPSVEEMQKLIQKLILVNQKSVAKLNRMSPFKRILIF